MFIFNNFSTCFGHHYAHLQENKTYVTACGVLRWYCWMWLVAAVGRCLVGVSYQPHPAEPAQHTTCSNTRLVLLKMGIMMPESCWEIVKNKHLTVASCWFSLSLHNLLTMHGHRKLKIRYRVHKNPTLPSDHSHPHPPSRHSSPLGQGFLIIEVSRSHSETPHSITPLDEWSARCTDLYLITHNTHNRQTYMSQARPPGSALLQPTAYNCIIGNFNRLCNWFRIFK